MRLYRANSEMELLSEAGFSKPEAKSGHAYCSCRFFPDVLTFDIAELMLILLKSTTFMLMMNSPSIETAVTTSQLARTRRANLSDPLIIIAGLAMYSVIII